MQALIEYKGKQFLVEENLEIKLPYLGGEVGDKFNVERILYIDNSKNKEFGKPYLNSISISGKILSHGRDDKIVVFKMKRRKGYQVKNGHRQNFTLVKIEKFKKVKQKAAKDTKKKVDTEKKADTKKKTSTTKEEEKKG